ncbi:hypothetical protein KJ059_01510 [Myxococcota bacterium]|nr:hypothetical protein [Myxococcota bacterium]MCZ7618337.1 hypothetical protein [Myxococcota bacterium]
MTEEHVQNERAAPEEENPEAAPVQSERVAPVTWKTFSAHFDRCFGRAYAYASRRVKDQASCERIVSELLEANLDLLVDRDDEEQDLRPLKTALDRLIGLELARGLAAGPSDSRAATFYCCSAWTARTTSTWSRASSGSQTSDGSRTSDT